jgi:hypothetical protein
MKIKFHANWCSDHEIREHFNRCTVNGDYVWKDLYISLNEYDYLVVLNHALGYLHYPQRTICFFSEPATTREHFKSFGWNPGSDYFCVYDTNKYHNVDKWYLTANYKELEKTPEKTKVLSGIVSGLRGMPGHEDRFKFLSQLDTLPYYEHFGRGDNLKFLKSYKGQLGSKEQGLLSYKYTFNCENYYEPGYFTEKLLDAIMCEALCFYSGCPNVDKFIDSNAFIRLDLTNQEKALQTVVGAINNNEWEKRIEIIRKEKQKLLNDMNPLNIVWKIVNRQI